VRIVSLLPAATEIICSIGLIDQLVGVSHECDYPPEVLTIPKLTNSSINPSLDSGRIDSHVTRSLRENGSLYTIDENLLRDLEPDVIFSQKLCNVCSVPLDTVDAISRKVANEVSTKYPKVVTLEPNSLNEVYDSIRTVGKITGREYEAKEVIIRMQSRAEYIRNKTSKFHSKRKILFLEWISPPYCAGHWIPDLIDAAGAVDHLARKQLPSIRIYWEDILQYRPETIIIAACGFKLDRIKRDSRKLLEFPLIEEIPAFAKGQVYAVDGNSYFNRPGPRIIDSLEILAQIVYPEFFYFGYDKTSYTRLEFHEEYVV
jgi:iron complex transport system substrate-binding protein